MKPDAESIGTDSKNTIHSVYATSSKYSGKEKKGPSVGKTQVKNPHQRSPHAMKFENRSMKRLKDNSDAPEARHGTLPKNLCKLQEKDKATLYSPAEEWVLAAASTKEPEERKFVADSGACMHVVSK